LPDPEEGDLLPIEADTAQDSRENMWPLLYRGRAEIDLNFFAHIMHDTAKQDPGHRRTIG